MTTSVEILNKGPKCVSVRNRDSMGRDLHGMCIIQPGMTQRNLIVHAHQTLVVDEFDDKTDPMMQMFQEPEPEPPPPTQQTRGSLPPVIAGVLGGPPLTPSVVGEDVDNQPDDNEGLDVNGEA
jgi:hypothetical protein